MLLRFENSAEYTLDNIHLRTFIDALVASDHFMIYTGVYEGEGTYVIGDPSLHEHPELVRQILVRCFSNETQGDAPESPDHPMHYVLLITPREGFMWTGKVMNLELGTKVDFDLREKRVRVVSDGPAQRLARSKRTFVDMFPAFRHNVIVEQKAHLASVNRETRKIGRAIYRLAETVLGSFERVRAVTFRRAGQGQELLGGYFTFTADLGTRSLRYLEPALRSRFLVALMKLSIQWIAFICDDCVPTDPRTFKWAVAALEYALSMNKNDNILKFSDAEFALLRSKVASCMTLLISHFDILGARSSYEAKKEQDRIDAARLVTKEQLATRLATLRETRRKTEDEDDASSVGSLQMAWEQRMEALKPLEDARASIEAGGRVVGRVLDHNLAEDRSLAFLASSSLSNISIRWQQGKFIGGGTFGNVYLAVNLDSGEELAVKEIRFQDLQSAPNLVKTIRDEMKVMEMLRHDNIVTYYGIEVHRDKVFIFEEYCPGGSLANLLEHGRIEDEIIIQIYALQMLSGLIYLHSQNVVHRDIKPDSASSSLPRLAPLPPSLPPSLSPLPQSLSILTLRALDSLPLSRADILLDGNGTIKYVDFGAAKVLAKNQKTLASRSRMSTGAPTVSADGVAAPADANSLTGTPMYLSPETVKGERRGKMGAMDVWAVGCVILECATGRRPWSNLDNEWCVPAPPALPRSLSSTCATGADVPSLPSPPPPLALLQGHHVPHRHRRPAPSPARAAPTLRARHRLHPAVPAHRPGAAPDGRGAHDAPVDHGGDRADQPRVRARVWADEQPAQQQLDVVQRRDGGLVLRGRPGGVRSADGRHRRGGGARRVRGGLCCAGRGGRGWIRGSGRRRGGLARRRVSSL